MWIVRLALNRPYTFIVLALLFLVATPVVLLKTPTDIFPNIDIPVISVVWDYTGLSADEMSTRITGNYEEDYKNSHMERGKAMEAEARSLYAFLHDEPLTQVGFIRNGNKGCSPDSLAGKRGRIC